MGVIYPRVEAGGSLVAPQWGAPPRQHVGERAVEQFKQLIPLSRVVQTRLMTAKPTGIMDDMLCVCVCVCVCEGTLKGTHGAASYVVGLTNLPRISPTTNSHTGAFSMNMSNVSSSAIGGK